MEAVEIYIERCWTIFPVEPCEHIRAKAGPSFAVKVMYELVETGHLGLKSKVLLPSNTNERRNQIAAPPSAFVARSAMLFVPRT
jgi:hypothetical protein